MTAPAPQDVVPRLALNDETKQVFQVVAPEGVIAIAPPQLIVTAQSDKRVVAFTAVEGIAAGAAP